MIRRPPRSTLSSSSAASDVYKRQPIAHIQVPAMAGMKGDPSYGVSSVSAAIVVYSPKESGNVSHSTFRLVVGLTNIHDRRVTLLASAPPRAGSDEQLGLTVVAQWSNLHPKFTATGEDNTIKGIAFVQGGRGIASVGDDAVSYTHLRAHETPEHLVCRLLLEKKKKKK
eukprot:TRINITY_DN56044_c0_g1_i1.p2 TRINITY_DN56044_c0_g1~~TRINITY_DN56044_c0_g1_i1.p2  ORF type:complete len:169 (-),score=66.15 TRINITY_DN56044_c0_g1_i1:50-556(-)